MNNKMPFYKRFNILLLLFTLSLQAKETITQEFTVSFVGLPVMTLTRTLEIDSSTTTITYDTQPYSRFHASFIDVANLYWVQYNNDDFSPITWGKKAHEFSWNQEFQVSMDSTGIIQYPNHQTVISQKPFLSLFSAVAYVEKYQPQKSISLTVLLEGRFWDVTVRPMGNDNNSMRYDIAFNDFDGQAIFEKTDVLLTKLSHKGTVLSIWVHPTMGVIRTQFGTPPMTVDVNRN
jgi:hypothetical protein